MSEVRESRETGGTRGNVPTETEESIGREGSEGGTEGNVATESEGTEGIEGEEEGLDATKAKGDSSSSITSSKAEHLAQQVSALYLECSGGGCVLHLEFWCICLI